ncbi:unnamed protein product [Spirodela intermedia]|uniref:Caffeoyl-CoA O-methyltransferase n=1 Tax=Spirodela intermedia TaxID=51605 RepID=A0ABN7EBE0_SPIIN|nr:unnamed protein product [Spirodela intermedia]
MATAEQQQNDSVEKNEGQSRHQEVGHKSLLQSDALYQYILETSHPWNIMTTSADEGQFLNLLLKLIGARKTIEIGYSPGIPCSPPRLPSPTTARYALSDRIRSNSPPLPLFRGSSPILAMDINRENFEIGLPVMEKAGVAHKVDFREGPGLPLLDQLLEHEKNLGSFDFAFVDADKDNYINYHKRLIELVKVGGVIGYDNTLWNGSVVAPPDAPMRKYVRYYRDFVLELNKALAPTPASRSASSPLATASHSAPHHLKMMMMTTRKK